MVTGPEQRNQSQLARRDRPSPRRTLAAAARLDQRRSARRELGQQSVVKQCHRGLGAEAAVMLELAEGVGQGPALDHEPIKADPGGRPVHAGVAMNENRPGGRVTSKLEVWATKASPEGSSGG